MAQLICQTQSALGAPDRRVGQSGGPAQQPGDGVGHDAGARAHPERDEPRADGTKEAAAWSASSMALGRSRSQLVLRHLVR